jgi:hypothetical protein
VGTASPSAAALSLWIQDFCQTLHPLYQTRTRLVKNRSLNHLVGQQLQGVGHLDAQCSGPRFFVTGFPTRSLFPQFWTQSKSLAATPTGWAADCIALIVKDTLPAAKGADVLRWRMLHALALMGAAVWFALNGLLWYAKPAELIWLAASGP